MTAVLEGLLPKSRILLCFLWERGLSARDIHEEKFPVYGGKCLSHKAVHSYIEKFSQGRSKVAYSVGLGCPVEIATEATVQRVKS
jgi:hypothetical protein